MIVLYVLYSVPPRPSIARDDYLFSFRFFPFSRNIPLSIHEESVKGENGQNVTIYLRIPLFNAIGFILFSEK